MGFNIKTLISDMMDRFQNDGDGPGQNAAVRDAKTLMEECAEELKRLEAENAALKADMKQAKSEASRCSYLAANAILWSLSVGKDVCRDLLSGMEAVETDLEALGFDRDVHPDLYGIIGG